MPGEAAVLRGNPAELPRLLAQQATDFLKRHRHTRSNVTPHPCGSVDLIFIFLPAADQLGTRVPRRRHPSTEDICAACATVLRPGGFLIVTKSLQRDHGLHELGEPTVDLCESIGLLYWQHVIALHAAIRDDQLVPRPSFWQLSTTRKALARGERIHLVCHEDVLVFRKADARARVRPP